MCPGWRPYPSGDPSADNPPEGRRLSHAQSGWGPWSPGFWEVQQATCDTAASVFNSSLRGVVPACKAAAAGALQDRVTHMSNDACADEAKGAGISWTSLYYLKCDVVKVTQTLYDSETCEEYAQNYKEMCDHIDASCGELPAFSKWVPACASARRGAEEARRNSSYTNSSEVCRGMAESAQQAWGQLSHVGCDDVPLDAFTDKAISCQGLVHAYDALCTYIGETCVPAANRESIKGVMPAHTCKDVARGAAISYQTLGLAGCHLDLSGLESVDDCDSLSSAYKQTCDAIGDCGRTWGNVDASYNSSEFVIRVPSTIPAGAQINLGEMFLGNPGVIRNSEGPTIPEDGLAMSTYKSDYPGFLAERPGDNGCPVANATNPCSCGEMLCTESCFFGEGLNCMTDVPHDWLPKDCYFLGCLPFDDTSQCRETWDSRNTNLLTKNEIRGPLGPVAGCRRAAEAAHFSYRELLLYPKNKHIANSACDAQKAGPVNSFAHLDHWDCYPDFSKFEPTLTCKAFAEAYDDLCDQIDSCIAEPHAPPAPPSAPTTANPCTEIWCAPKLANVNFRKCPLQMHDARRPANLTTARMAPVPRQPPADQPRLWSHCVSPTQAMDGEGEADSHACDNEHKGVMLLSGREVVVCCPGEPTDPFADGNLGYFGLISPVVHGSQRVQGFEGARGYLGITGAECDEDGCTYFPQCACPVAIPSLNMKTTGVPNMLPPVRVRRGFDCSDGADCASGGKLYAPGKHSNKTEPRIVIAPCVERGSYFSAYSVFIGNPDAAHLGDDVRLDNSSWTRIFNKASSQDPEWTVRAPTSDPASSYDGAAIHLAPRVGGESSLKMGPTFVGSPGRVVLGKEGESWDEGPGLSLVVTASQTMSEPIWY